MFWTGIAIKSSPFHGLAYDLIKRRIRVGAMRPDEQFPAERKLAETLGISRATLREALKRLETEGYIRSLRGAKGGTFVADDEVVNRLARENLLARPEAAWRSLEYLGAVLERAAVVACERRSPSDLAAMRSAVEALQVARTAGDVREAQFLFLAALAQGSANDYFREAIEAAVAGLAIPITSDGVGSHAETLQPTWRKLVDAIADRHAARTAAAARNLFDLMSSATLAAMRDKPPLPKPDGPGPDATIAAC